MYTNLALRRPATQSSVSRWSKFQKPEADAAGANNGNIDGQPGFHTAYEPHPWWQVDLQSLCVVSAVRIFNRQVCAYRMRRFRLLASLDGSHWLLLHRKSDDTDFGVKNLEPYTIPLPPDTAARYLRIQLDGEDVMHFCECEVVGEKADKAAAKALQEKFARQLREAALEDEQRQSTLRDGRNGFIRALGSVSVFVDTDNYSPKVIKTLTEGWYEGQERGLVSKLIRANDRVLEVGTALGAVTMTTARIAGAKNILTFEANPQIAADARRNFAFNDLDDIQSRVGVLCNRLRFGSAPGEVEFSISRDFWSSRLHVGQISGDIVRTVRVPTACLEDQIRDHGATVLICDIEGGEIELLIGADLTGLRMILMEVHNWAVGAAATDAMMRWLIVNGFNVDLQHSGANIAILNR
jgi:FkbM family methyltransferase